LLLEERKLKMRDVVILVAVIGTLITVLALIPQFAIRILFLVAYSFALFSFTYILVPRWYISVLPPVAFLAFYFFSWNLLTLNIFSAIFAIAISLYLGNVFTWKTTSVFAGLLVIVDVIQVLGTRFMVSAAEKIVSLQLPAMMILPTFPMSGLALIGLGDLFLTGLLVIQSTRKYGRQFGFYTCILISTVFFIVWNLALTFNFGFLPATAPIILGWLIALTPKVVSSRQKAHVKEAKSE